jgi:hypothetical protein
MSSPVEMIHYMTSKKISLPFSSSTSSGTLSLLKNRLSEFSLHVPVLKPQILCSESSLQFAENTTIVFLSLARKYSRSECPVVSKTFSISKNTAAVNILLLEFKVTCSVSLVDRSVIMWSARKSNWLTFSKFPSSVCFWIVLKIISNNFPVVNKRLIGRKFWSLPCFGRVMNFLLLPRYFKVTKPKAVFE